MCRKSWHRIRHINKMAERPENQVIFLFVVLVIMHLMSAEGKKRQTYRLEKKEIAGA